MPPFDPPHHWRIRRSRKPGLVREHDVGPVGVVVVLAKRKTRCDLPLGQDGSCLSGLYLNFRSWGILFTVLRLVPRTEDNAESERCPFSSVDWSTSLLSKGSFRTLLLFLGRGSGFYSAIDLRTREMGSAPQQNIRFILAIGSLGLVRVR